VVHKTLTEVLDVSTNIYINVKVFVRESESGVSVNTSLNLYTALNVCSRKVCLV